MEMSIISLNLAVSYKYFMEEIFDFNAIYPDVQNIHETVSIVRHMSEGKTVCILGVLMTEAGLQIENEML